MAKSNQLAHQTRHLTSVRSNARGLWNDSASKHIEQRFLRPHEQAAGAMVDQIEARDRAAVKVENAVGRVRAKAADANAAAERARDGIQNSRRSQASTYEYSQQAWQHEDSAARLEAEALQLAEEAQSACNGCPTRSGGQGGAVSIRLADRASDELTDDEINALLEYTGDSYSEMNAELRGFTTETRVENGQVVKVEKRVTLDKTAADAQRLSAAMNGLKKLPVHQGEVYRGTKMRAQDLAQYREGATVVQTSFISASTSKDTARTFMGTEGNVLMTITSQSGRDVSAISQFGGEREILFTYGSRLEVTSVSQAGPVTHIMAREVL